MLCCMSQNRTTKLIACLCEKNHKIVFLRVGESSDILQVLDQEKSLILLRGTFVIVQTLNRDLFVRLLNFSLQNPAESVNVTLFGKL